MDAVIDTVALIRHLDDSLPRRSERIFREAENGEATLFLPEVALGEFAYLALRGRIGAPEPRSLVEEVLTQVRGSGYIQLAALGPMGWGSFLDLAIPELHDRMIASLAISRGLPLVSNDPAFLRVPSLSVVWR
ncbi:MAG: PIN domain-containing protein [Thermoplasmata archaeon]|nr:PIN domain-containing protein [Thermoplasmata archaeon]MCI4341509.1 PIN domain-containing protein [Thermoplasmata archaeon]